MDGVNGNINGMKCGGVRGNMKIGSRSAVSYSWYGSANNNVNDYNNRPD